MASALSSAEPLPPLPPADFDDSQFDNDLSIAGNANADRVAWMTESSGGSTWSVSGSTSGASASHRSSNQCRQGRAAGAVSGRDSSGFGGGDSTGSGGEHEYGDRQSSSSGWRVTIDPAELELGRVLGEGTYGRVHEARCRGSAVAVKVMHMGGGETALDEAWRRAFEHEVAMLTELRHRHIVQFLGSCVDGDGNYMIVSELCTGGDLDSLLAERSREPLSLAQRVSMALDVSRALGWLHGNQPAVLHRDLKPANLLLERGTLTLKVADFGLAAVAGVRRRRGTERPDARVIDTRPIGTPKWISPEQIVDGLSSRASDVYSFGIILWQLVARRDDPWPHVSSKPDLYKRVVEDGERPSVDPSVQPSFREAPASLIELIQQCWDGNPEKRPMFDEIVGRLEKIVVDCAIPADPSAADFWKEKFLGQDNVRWDEFWTAFSDVVPQRSVTDAAVECLHQLVSNKVDSVSLEAFGRFAANFGPLDSFFDEARDPSLSERRNAASILDRIVDTCSASWFHGEITQEEATRRLNGRSPGTFLVRFSSRPGNFAVSRVSSNGSQGIVHARVELDRQWRFLDGGEAFSSLRALVDSSPSVCIESCPGSAFASIFAQDLSASHVLPGLDHGYLTGRH